MNSFKKQLESHQLLLADGATGTNLFSAGLQTGDCPELWNIDHPEKISRLHQSFVEAGSDIILTNSFGGNHYRLALHDARHRVAELNYTAASLARSVADKADRPVVVAGSIGPSGEIFAPNGPLGIEEASKAFAEQAQALADGGVDVIWIETLSSAQEIEAAVLGAASVDLPIACTVSIDTNGRTMMGMTPADTVAVNEQLEGRLAAIGNNCGVGASEVVAATCNMARAIEQSRYRPALIAKANCGIPEFIEGRIHYNGTPELMANYVVLCANAGARIIGGCCGTTPEHIAAMRVAMDNWQPGAPVPQVDQIVATLGELSQGARSQMAGDLSVAAGSASGRGARGSRRKRSSRS